MVMVKVEDNTSTGKAEEHVEILILGAGWTSTFLLPLLKREGISWAATTTTGRDGTIKFRFNPESNDETPYELLPSADTVLITFPLKGTDQPRLLTSLYHKTHKKNVRWILLGSTGAFQGSHWLDYQAPVDLENERVKAESELLELGPNIILHLAGLYGGQRDPKTWLPRIIKTKADIKNRKALHLVHGEDVARAIAGAHSNCEALAGKRWLITDIHVYDWWELIYEWSGEMEIESGRIILQETVFECMREDKVRALPRGSESLGRILDSTAFWRTIGTYPIIGRVR